MNKFSTYQKLSDLKLQILPKKCPIQEEIKTIFKKTIKSKSEK